MTTNAKRQGISVFFGRDRDLNKLTSVLETALRDSGPATVLFIDGAIGIGKTALVTQTLSRITTRVVIAGPTEFENALPLDALRPILEEVLGQTFAETLQSSPSLRELAKRLAAGLGDDPTLLVVDDAHWLDSESLTVLEYLMSEPGPALRAFIFVHRPQQLPIKLNDAVRRLGLPLNYFCVRPLNSEHIRGIVQHLDDSGQEEVVLNASGNPLFARLLANLWDAHPTKVEFTQLLEGAHSDDTLGVGYALQRDIERIPEQDRLVLQSIAVLNRAFPETLSLLSGLDVAVITASVDSLTRHGLLAYRDGSTVIAHPLVRSSAYHSAGATWLLESHRKCAELQDTLSEIERLEHLHLLGTELTQDEMVLLLEGAERVLGTSPSTAVRWLQSTLSRPSMQRDALLARALMVSGHPQEALEPLSRLRAAGDTTAEVFVLSTNCFRMLGRMQEAQELERESVSIEDVPLQIELATLAIMVDRWMEVRERLELLIRNSEEQHDVSPLALAAKSIGTLGLLNEGRVVEAQAQFEQLLDQLLALPDTGLRDIIDAVAGAAWSAYLLEYYAQGALLVERSIRVARRFGRVHTLAHLYLVSSFLHVSLGAIFEADRAAEDAISAARQFSWPSVIPMALTSLMLSAAWSQNNELLQRRLEELETVPPASVSWWDRTIRSTMARVSTQLGRPRPPMVFEDAQDATLALRYADAATISLLSRNIPEAKRYVTAARIEADRHRLSVQQAYVYLADARIHAYVENNFTHALELVDWAKKVFERKGMSGHIGLTHAMQAEFENLKRSSPLTLLTSRELEIAKLVASGDSNKQIALALNISTRTVEGHVAQILNKLQLSSRSAIGSVLAR